MAPSYLSQLDIGHLYILRQVLTDRSVTRAAEKLSAAQPHVSRVLGRLRKAFGDPLIVRSGHEHVLTDRGLVVLAGVRDVLQRLDQLSTEQASFEPASSDRAFHIAIADCVSIGMLLQIIGAISASGPRIKIIFRAVDPAFDVTAALRDAEIDIAIDNIVTPPAGLRVRQLYRDELVLLSAKGHRSLQGRRPSLDEYLALSHLAPHPTSARDSGPVEQALSKANVSRKISVTLPEFNLVPHILQSSELVFTTGGRFARFHASTYDLMIVPAPDLFKPIIFNAMWHERSHHSPALHWLREVVLNASLADPYANRRTIGF